jgi:maltose O-acetyltransferase
MRFRGFLYGIAMKRCGVNLQVSSSVIFKNLENCSFGRDVYLAPNVVINAIAKIKLEDEVMVGFNSVLSKPVMGSSKVFGGIPAKLIKSIES